MTCKKGCELQVLSGNLAGFYIGTLCEDGFPNCRLSEEYFKTRDAGVRALKEAYLWFDGATKTTTAAATATAVLQIRRNSMSEIVFTQCINGPLRVGDLVLSTIEDKFVPCLPGVVERIDLLGTPEHETQNETDDVYVNFTGDFSLKRQEDIARHYNEFTGLDRPFEEAFNDLLIMGPDCLLNITGVTEDKLTWLRESERNAIVYAYELVHGLLTKSQAEPSVCVSLPDGHQLTAKANDIRPEAISDRMGGIQCGA